MSGRIIESRYKSEKSKRKTVLKMFIQYGYQKFLIREIKDLRLKKQASVMVSAEVFENQLCDLLNNNCKVRFYIQ